MNLQGSTPLCLSSAGITGTTHHTQLYVSFSSESLNPPLTLNSFEFRIILLLPPKYQGDKGMPSCLNYAGLGIEPRALCLQDRLCI